MSSRSPSPPDELYVPPVDSTDDELIDDFYDTQDDLDDELDEDIDMDPEDILLRALIQAEARERTPIDQDSEDEDSVSAVEEDPAVVRLLSSQFSPLDRRPPLPLSIFSSCSPSRERTEHRNWPGDHCSTSSTRLESYVLQLVPSSKQSLWNGGRCGRV